MRFFKSGLFIALLSCSWLACAADPLPQLGANAEGVTVSGLSSGAYMAVQFQVAHARQVSGAGIIAGGPFYCAEGSVTRALANCMAPTATAKPPSLEMQLQTVAKFAGQGRIDAPALLKTHRVWLFSGANDQTVHRPVMDSLAGFYQSLLPESAIRYVRHPEAGHAMPAAAADQANACPTSESPYLNRCQEFDAAGELLNHLLGPLAPKSQKPEGSLLRFDQRPYVTGKAVDASFAEEGYLYVPHSCLSGGCRIHIAFHGCRQNAEAVGTSFVTGAGYNAWAETNRIIVLYPQTRARYGLALGSMRYVMNPKGCWDWWGYTGSDYATREGTQIKAVATMLETLKQRPAK